MIVAGLLLSSALAACGPAGRGTIKIAIVASLSGDMAAAGDTAKSVAAKFKLTVEEFCKANPTVRSDSVLNPGESYWIPGAKR